MAIDAFADQDLPTMGADHALADRQAQAGALPASVAAGRGVEHVEDFLAFRHGDARPLVADREPQLLVVHRHLQFEAALGGRKARCVFQHVDQRLLDQRGMHEQQRQLGGHLGVHPQGREHHA
ncbi:hypothetical protein D3C73_1427000 [compost metagenome]